MKNISKNISTVCRAAIRNARKLQLEHTESRQNMRYCYLQKHSQRSLRIRFTSRSLYYANDNRVSNCAIDCRQDLINYAVPIPPVLRVTILYTFICRILYVPSLLRYRSTASTTVLRVAVSFGNSRTAARN